MLALGSRESLRRFARRVGASVRPQSGASFLIALFFTLICAFVAAVVLSSAAVNAERASRHADDEQGYFSVASALDLGEAFVKRDLCAPDFTIPSVLTAENVASAQASLTASSDPLGLRSWAIEALYKKRSNPAQVQPKYLVVSAEDLGASGIDLPAVLLAFTMEDTGGHIAVRACQNVWSDAQIANLDLSDADTLQKALVEGAESEGVTYANVLQKRLWNNGSGIDLVVSGSTGSWVVVSSEEAGS